MFNIFKDIHTYVVIAIFISAGLTAVSTGLPPMANAAVAGVLGVLAIFIQQYGKTV